MPARPAHAPDCGIMTPATVMLAVNSLRNSAVSGRGQFRNGNQRDRTVMRRVCPCAHSSVRHVLGLIAQADRGVRGYWRQGRVPLFPGIPQGGEPLRLTRGAIGAFALIVREVEEVVVAIHPQELPPATPPRPPAPGGSWPDN